MTERENDKLTEHIRQLEAENNQLTGKLKAANREIERMHKQMLLAKAAATRKPPKTWAPCPPHSISAQRSDTAFPHRTARWRPASRSSTGSLRNCTA